MEASSRRSVKYGLKWKKMPPAAFADLRPLRSRRSLPPSLHHCFLFAKGPFLRAINVSRGEGGGGVEGEIQCAKIKAILLKGGASFVYLQRNLVRVW